MQVTLSRQTGKRLQYFVAYTYGKTKGTLGGEYSTIDPYDPNRTYGVLGSDRRHILNVSWNAFLPDGARGGMSNTVTRGLLNGWQLSGISSVASGIPIRPTFSGDAGKAEISAAYFGTADVVGPSNPPATASHRFSRATRQRATPGSARNCSISTASRCRTSGPTARSCRSSTSAPRHA